MSDRYQALADYLRQGVEVSTPTQRAALEAAALVIEDYSRVLSILKVLDDQLDHRVPS